MRATKLRLFVAAIVASAGAAVALLPLTGARVDPVALLLLVVLAVFAGARPVRFVGKGNEITATHSAIICALAILGALPALVTALAGMISSLMWRPGRAKAIRTVFNFANVAFSAALASHVFFALGGVPGDIRSMLLWPLLATAATYFLANNGLVAMAVALDRSWSFGKAFESLRWTAASYLTGVVLALGLLVAYDYLGPAGLAFGLPPIWVMLNFYSAYHDKLQEKKRRIQEVESLNSELHAKVDELREALSEVSELRKLLPICMHCKSIRDDDNTWHRIEGYISKHYDADFTHSLCEDCREVHYDISSTTAASSDED